MNDSTWTPHTRGKKMVSRQGTYPVPFQYQPIGLPCMLLAVPIDYSMMVYYIIGLYVLYALEPGTAGVKGVRDPLLRLQGLFVWLVAFLCLLSIAQSLGQIGLKGQQNCLVCHYIHFCLPRCPGDPQNSMSPGPDLPAGHPDSSLPRALSQASPPSLHPQGARSASLPGCLPSPHHRPTHGMFHGNPVATSECIFVIPPADV